MENRVFFLNPPSFEGFDGGAGSRYQAKREIRSFWYPTWLAQSAAFCEDSKLLDAPADEVSVEETIKMADGFGLIVIYTSTPGFENDAMIAYRIKEQYKDTLIAMVGPHTTVLPEETLKACPAVDFVVRGEFDHAILEAAQGKPFAHIKGISYNENSTIIHNEQREPVEDMDSLPSVLDVYKRDLTVENYFIGYLLHPYLSVYTGRGCTSRCIFCLWPQTIAGHKYRTRSVQSVVNEISRARGMFPQVKEFFFDDDTFTSDLKRAEDIARGLGGLGVTWSSSAKVTVPYETLEVMKDGGLRSLMVGVESGSDAILKNIKKGITTNQALKFMKACRKLDIKTHATFSLGLPGETKTTIKETIEFAKRLDPDTIQVSIATPYPGTEFYRLAIENGWLGKCDSALPKCQPTLGNSQPATQDESLVSGKGVQQACLNYEGLSSGEIFDSVETFYNSFYFRAKPILRIVGTMIRDKDIRKRRLREAREFFSFMKKRKHIV